jgi:heme O synthase-like polyprenyltransferase
MPVNNQNAKSSQTYTPRSVFIPSIINIIIFILLAVLHLYWAFGGKLLYDDVLPTSSNGLNKFEPGTGAAFIIGGVLLVFAFLTAGNMGMFDRYLNRRLFRYSVLIIAVIFFLRAVGDFKFVGFF